MAADRFLTLDGRPTVRVEREYPHPIDKVWRAVTTPEHLGRWFPSPVEIDLRPGGAIHFSAFEGQPAAAGTVEVVDAPQRLTFTWGTDRLTFELVAHADRTTFVITHSFDDRYGAASFATGWEMCLLGLRSVLAGEDTPPPDRGVARHEALVHEFALDQPEITESDGRWTVRVERQLTCPADVAWDLWFGTDRDTGEQRRAPGVGEPLTRSMAPDVAVGTITEGELHRLLAFDTGGSGGPGDHVRVELADGTGHGARITLTVTGRDPGERDAAAEMWGAGAVGHLAAMASGWAQEQPVGADVSAD
jgi:uncharacterized protein YndB with AHSA1/START domain